MHFHAHILYVLCITHVRMYGRAYVRPKIFFCLIYLLTIITFYSYFMRNISI